MNLNSLHYIQYCNPKSSKKSVTSNKNLKNKERILIIQQRNFRFITQLSNLLSQ